MGAEPRQPEPLLEALVELARSAIRADRERAAQRAKLEVVEPKRRGGRAA